MSGSGGSALAPGDPREGRSPWSWARGQLLLTLVQSLVLGMLGSALGLAFGRTVPIIGSWAVAAICMLAFRLHRLLLPPRQRRRSLWDSIERSGVDPMQAELAELPAGLRREGAAPIRAGQHDTSWLDPLPPTLEHRFTRMYRHTDRVTYAVAAERHYDSGVRPILIDLVSDRLRRYQVIDLNTQSALAREVLGEDLWHALYEPLGRVPSTADLERWVAQIERLSEPMEIAPQARSRSRAAVATMNVPHDQTEAQA